MPNTLVGELYKQHAKLASNYAKTQRKETVAIRSVNGTAHPVGAPGQVLIDFSTGSIRYWDEGTETWVLFNAGGGGGGGGASYYPIQVQGRATTAFVTPARPLVLPLPLASPTIARIELAVVLEGTHDISNYITFDLSTASNPSLWTYDTVGSDLDVVVDRTSLFLSVGDDWLEFTAEATGTATCDYTLVVFLQAG
jgi:hypothetical protein